MPTDAELDAAATELRGTLEVMLSHVDDQEANELGVKPSQAVWRPTKRPTPACWICGKLMPGIYATGKVGHTRCVAYQDRSRR